MTMGKNAIHATWCSAFAIVQALAGVCNAQVQMEWHLPVGSCWRVEVTQSTRTETLRGERRDAVSMETAMELGWVVERVEADGSMHLEQRYQRFRLKTSTPDTEPITYDSASSQTPTEEVKPIAKLMRPLIGMRHQIVLSRRGEVQRVELPAETESLLGDLPEMARWKKMLTRDGIDRVLRQSLGVLPESAVNVGDRWTSTQQVDSPFGTLDIKTNYRYEGPRLLAQRTVQHIRAAMETNVTDEDAAQSLTERMRSKQQAVYYFDTALGRLAESHLRQTVSSQVPYAGSKIDVVSVGNVTLRISANERE